MGVSNREGTKHAKEYIQYFSMMPFVSFAPSRFVCFFPCVVPGSPVGEIAW